MRRRILRQDFHAQRRTDATQAHPLGTAAFLLHRLLQTVRSSGSPQEAHSHPPEDAFISLVSHANAVRLVHGTVVPVGRAACPLANVLVPVIVLYKINLYTLPAQFMYVFHTCNHVCTYKVRWYCSSNKMSNESNYNRFSSHLRAEGRCSKNAETYGYGGSLKSEWNSLNVGQ